MGTSNTVPEIRREQLGEREVVLKMEHEAAVDHVRSVFRTVGFAVPSEFSPSDRINAARDDDVDPYHVLGFGVPDAGAHALDVGDERVGALFPCSVVVWESEPGVQHVYHLSRMRIASELGLAPDTGAWRALVAQLEKMVDDAFAALDRDDRAAG